MKQCPKCNIEHSKLGTYCSRTCANSRVFSDATNQKRSQSNRKAVLAFSNEKKTEVVAKRLATYREHKPINTCVDCSKVIRRTNKHNRCQECYHKSDVSSLATGHYRKYKRLSVVDSYGSSVYLMSSMEIQYFDWLTKNNIKWKKPESIRYFDNTGKSHWYKPDFYLVDSEEVIEIKGHFWNNDKIKMQWVIEQNPNLKIKILRKPDLDTILS